MGLAYEADYTKLKLEVVICSVQTDGTGGRA